MTKESTGRYHQLLTNLAAATALPVFVLNARDVYFCAKGLGARGQLLYRVSAPAPPAAASRASRFSPSRRAATAPALSPTAAFRLEGNPV